MAQSPYIAVALLIVVGVAATNASAAGQAATDLAAQVRTQGFTCDKPQSAEKNDNGFAAQ